VDPEERIAALEAQLAALAASLRALQIAAPDAVLRRLMAAMAATPEGALLLQQGILSLPSTAAARTDRGAEYEANTYPSGGNLILQVWSPDHAAWKSVTLT